MLGTARQGVDALVDISNRGLAIALAPVVRDKKKLQLNTGAGTSELTGKGCTPNLVRPAALPEKRRETRPRAGKGVTSRCRRDDEGDSTDDDVFGIGRVREDGQKLHPAYLFEVKAQSASKYPWDYYTPVSTTPLEEAFRPMSQGGCPVVARL